MKWMKLRFKSTIWNIRNKKAFNQNSKKKEVSKNEDIIRSLWDISKCINSRIIGVPEGEEEEQEIENLFEKVMKENFLNLGKEIEIQVQEAQKVPNKIDTKRTTLRHHN